MYFSSSSVNAVHVSLCQYLQIDRVLDHFDSCQISPDAFLKVILLKHMYFELKFVSFYLVNSEIV